jgi:hexulose-6-phosphate isomerase
MQNIKIDRRNFLKYTAAITAGSSLFNHSLAMAETSKNQKLLKAVKIGMLPGDLSDEDKFKLAKRCGFDGIDGVPLDSLDAARKQADLARAAGVEMHGIVYGWWPPAPLKTKKDCLAGMQNALRCAHAMDATTVLLVPTRITDEYSYADAYKDSQKMICELIPLAEELKVTIAIENVWSKFLLSPIECARYLDELDSPWVRAYFDVGNVIIHGFAQDWIRTLGKRIIKLDLKDFKRDGYQWKNLGEGDVNWPEVCKALKEINFSGYMTAELAGGDEAYLTDIAQRIDRLVTV